MDSILDLLSPAQWCQTLFILSATAILIIQALPRDVRSALMNYGARRPHDAQGYSKKQDDPFSGEMPRGGVLKRVAERVTSYGQVPHRWFLHFYIASTALSVFWAWQYFSRGAVIRALAMRQDRDGEGSMLLGDVFVAWLLMAVQGVRRLYESLYVSKPGSSPMWVVHWALGLIFYATMSISVWIHGSSSILISWDDHFPYRLITGKTLVGLSLYVFACWKQNECHRYLASLRKYTLPTEGSFKYIVCPHYTFECLIYLALAWIAAPIDCFFNRTVLCGLIFVAVNLGATAYGTKKWYAEKFGADRVVKRWNMVPFVF